MGTRTRRSARGVLRVEPEPVDAPGEPDAVDAPGHAGRPDSESGAVMSTTEVAALLGVSAVTIRRAIASGRIPAGRTPGGHARVLRDVAEALARELGHPGTSDR